MNDGASQIVIPGQRPPPPTADTGTPVIVWAVGIAAIALVGFMILRGRRRTIDPGELAFRRLASGLELKRNEVRAIRRASAAPDMPSPAAITLSPALTERALRDHAKPRPRTTPMRRAA